MLKHPRIEAPVRVSGPHPESMRPDANGTNAKRLSRKQPRWPDTRPIGRETRRTRQRPRPPGHKSERVEGRDGMTVAPRFRARHAQLRVARSAVIFVPEPRTFRPDCSSQHLIRQCGNRESRPIFENPRGRRAVHACRSSWVIVARRSRGSGASMIIGRSSAGWRNSIRAACSVRRSISGRSSCRPLRR